MCEGVLAYHEDIRGVWHGPAIAEELLEVVKLDEMGEGGVRRNAGAREKETANIRPPAFVPGRGCRRRQSRG